MSLTEIIILMLVIIGIVGAGWIIIAGIIYAYGYFENLKIKKEIPDKIKKEVENERIKREARIKDASRRYADNETSEAETGIDRDNSEIPDRRNIAESENIQRMDDVRDAETERRSKPDRRGFKFNPV